MIDKELEAIVKCHEYLSDLNNDSRMRVFKYLFDRYGLVNNQTNNLPIEKNYEENKIEIFTYETEEKLTEKIDKTKIVKSPATKRNKSSSAKSYSLITSLNLLSGGSESLRDYFAKFETRTNFDYNIVILNYLKNILQEDNVGVNHIYTCYKHLGLKIPNIKQSLHDTKNRKGWIETSDSNDLTVTVAGENYLDHEIVSKK